MGKRWGGREEREIQERLLRVDSTDVMWMGWDVDGMGWDGMGWDEMSWMSKWERRVTQRSAAMARVNACTVLYCTALRCAAQHWHCRRSAPVSYRNATEEVDPRWLGLGCCDNEIGSYESYLPSAICV
ncbi:hypothetical protein VTL71DRAFT_15094 [Oculimacula yallundae]|uniref:Uncharacterized protein n=1 Tax=Oculimacula yallundae TaxID=86028 RepID=A0ABR4CFK9_9HELO